MSVENGRGIVTYYKISMFTHQEDYVTDYIQITKFSSHDLYILNVYRSSKCNSVQLKTKLIRMINPGKSITGDLHICVMRNP